MRTGENQINIGELQQEIAHDTDKGAIFATMGSIMLILSVTVAAITDDSGMRAFTISLAIISALAIAAGAQLLVSANNGRKELAAALFRSAPLLDEARTLGAQNEGPAYGTMQV